MAGRQGDRRSFIRCRHVPVRSSGDAGAESFQQTVRHTGEKVDTPLTECIDKLLGIQHLSPPVSG